jgi:Domain of unknown function (DUF3560)
MLTITHTHAGGTLIEGSSKGDGVYEILKGLRDNWRYFPSIRAIGIGQSRDHLADTYKISRAAEALRAAGHDVTTEIDETSRRSFAEAEADRNERAQNRAGRMAGYADKAAARSTAACERAHQMAGAIPFGQPMMPDHYSYGRDRRYRDRIHNLQGKSIEEGRKADHYQHRAANAEDYQSHRESVPVTLRRIAKLEAEQRQLQRRLDGSGLALYGENEAATGAYAQRLTIRLADVAGELAYWRGIVATAAADGAKVWGPADFAKGDYVLTDGSTSYVYEVLKVNPKSVTVPSCMGLIGTTRIISRAAAEARAAGIGYPMRTDTIPYDSIRGRKSAAEIGDLTTT